MDVLSLKLGAHLFESCDEIAPCSRTWEHLGWHMQGSMSKNAEMKNVALETRPDPLFEGLFFIKTERPAQQSSEVPLFCAGVIGRSFASFQQSTSTSRVALNSAKCQVFSRNVDDLHNLCAHTCASLALALLGDKDALGT